MKMMIGKEIIDSFTQEQQKEFFQDIDSIIKKLIDAGNIHGDKLHEIKSNLRLNGDIFLNVTLGFEVDSKGEIHGNILELKKIETVDQYLDSINEDKGLLGS